MKSYEDFQLLYPNPKEAQKAYQRYVVIYYAGCIATGIIVEDKEWTNAVHIVDRAEELMREAILRVDRESKPEVQP